MEQAIKKAIEEEWVFSRKDVSLIEVHKDNLGKVSVDIKPTSKVLISINDVLLDPLFWQALGKALGWDPDTDFSDLTHYDDWRGYWHQFIDHLAEGKDADSFFTDLLK